MLIRKESQELSATIFKQDGFGKKASQAELLKITFPSQMFAYDLEAKELLHFPITFRATFYPLQREAENQLEGEWSILDFYEMASKAAHMAEDARSLISSDPTFSMEAQLTDECYAWCHFKALDTSDGLFKKSDMQNIQFVNLSIKGRQTGSFQWVDGMLEPLTKLADQFKSQQNSFHAQVNGVIQKGS